MIEVEQVVAMVVETILSKLNRGKKKTCHYCKEEGHTKKFY